MSLGIIALGYNRPKKMRALLESLEKYSGNFREILVSIDYHSEVMHRAHVSELTRFMGNKKFTFYFHTTNKGLKKNLYTAIENMAFSHDLLMFLEDDLIIRPNFDLYLESAISKLISCEITSASLYSYPDVYSIRKSDFTMVGADCWGFIISQAKWRDFMAFKDYRYLNWIQRLRFNFFGTYNFYTLYKEALDGKNWAVLFYYWAFVNSERVLYPKESLVYNNGLDGSGINCDSNTSYNSSSIYINTSPQSLSNQAGHLSFILFFIHEKISRRLKAIKKLFIP